MNLCCPGCGLLRRKRISLGRSFDDLAHPSLPPLRLPFLVHLLQWHHGKPVVHNLACKANIWAILVRLIPRGMVMLPRDSVSHGAPGM